MTRDRLVAVASEAGAVPFSAAETVRRGRLGPGELLLVEPGRRSILEDAEAKTRALRALPIHDAARPMHDDRIESSVRARARTPTHVSTARARPALPGRPRRRTGPARHQDHGARGPRAAVEHGRRHADARPRPPRPAGRRPPPPGLRPGHEPGHRPGARARRHGPARRARPPAGAARRSAARTADGPARAPGRRRPRRPAGGRPCRGRRTVRILDATWAAADGPRRPRGRARSAGSRGRRRRPTRRRGPRPDRPRRVARIASRSPRSWRPGRSTPP